MPGRGEDRSKSGERGGLFATTRWSLILAAGESRNPDAREALATLCGIYWYPVYALVRQLGEDAEQARDLTQGFFVDLLERQVLKVATPERGRFRSFLRAAVRNYLSHERKRAGAGKRGGGKQLLSLDFDDAEARYRLEASDDQTPDRLFEKRWARALLTRALERLREETRESADGERLRRLETFLTGGTPHPTYGQVAAELGTSESAIKTAVHRMRERFGKLVRDEVANTVGNPEEIDDELRYLFSVL